MRVSVRARRLGRDAQGPGGELDPADALHLHFALGKALEECNDTRNSSAIIRRQPHPGRRHFDGTI